MRFAAADLDNYPNEQRRSELPSFNSPVRDTKLKSENLIKFRAIPISSETREAIAKQQCSSNDAIKATKAPRAGKIPERDAYR